MRLVCMQPKAPRGDDVMVMSRPVGAVVVPAMGQSACNGERCVQALLLREGDVSSWVVCVNMRSCSGPALLLWGG